MTNTPRVQLPWRSQLPKTMSCSINSRRPFPPFFIDSPLKNIRAATFPSSLLFWTLSYPNGCVLTSMRVNYLSLWLVWVIFKKKAGVRFMYEAVMGMRKHEGQGCILADDMWVLMVWFGHSALMLHRGLGKTLQVRYRDASSFYSLLICVLDNCLDLDTFEWVVWRLFTNHPQFYSQNRIRSQVHILWSVRFWLLARSPSSMWVGIFTLLLEMQIELLQNWKSEFHKWLGRDRISVVVCDKDKKVVKTFINA